MGRLTEYFQYLETPPDKLMDFKFRSAWITIKDEDKKLRRKLKLYNKQDMDIIQHLIYLWVIIILFLLLIAVARENKKLKEINKEILKDTKVEILNKISRKKE